MNDTPMIPVQHVVWHIRHAMSRSVVPDYVYESPDKKLGEQAVRMMVQDAAREAGKYVIAHTVYGEAEEPKTVSVPYKGSTPYAHTVVEEGVAYDDVRSEWRELVWIALLPPLLLLEPRRVARPWRTVETYTGTTPYAGSVPFTYVTERRFDPFVEQRFGPRVWDAPVFEEARLRPEDILLTVKS